jgi:hypothetical protein
LTLIYDGPLSNFAFKFNLHRYSLADHFGLQKSCLDATFTAEPVEVPSNLGNSVDALSHWLNNMMDIKGIAVGAETESQYRDTVAELHAHVFQNYLHWGEYTGMLHAAAHRAALRGGGHDERDMVLAAFMSADNDGLWDQGNREQSVVVLANAHVHHLCLWFLLYGESANLRHTSEAMCFIFHAAMCALLLEDAAPAPHAFNGLRPPAGRQLVLARPVPGAPMPYPTDDYLNSVVRRPVRSKPKTLIPEP